MYRRSGPRGAALGRRSGIRQRDGGDGRERRFHRYRRVCRHRRARSTCASAMRPRGFSRRTLQAGGGRYRGIRASHVVHDPNPEVLGAAFNGVPHLLLDGNFRAGFRHLAPLGLSYDAWQLEYQLGELRRPRQSVSANASHRQPLGRPVRHRALPGSARRALCRLAREYPRARAMPECGDEAGRPRHADVRTAQLLRRQFTWLTAIGGGLAALYRKLHRGLRPGSLHVRKQLSGGFRHGALPADLECLQANRERGLDATRKLALFGRTAARLYRLDLRARDPKQME